MKPVYFLIFLFLIFCRCKPQNRLVDQMSWTYFTRQSKFNFEYWSRNRDSWQELKHDTVILTRYMKDSPCDLPLPQSMSMKIIHDTLFFDFGRVYDPGCERKIGVGGILIDFVLNKRRYPNYKKLVIQYNYLKPY